LVASLGAFRPKAAFQEFHKGRFCAIELNPDDFMAPRKQCGEQTAWL
jgi:hypothetical protein